MRTALFDRCVQASKTIAPPRGLGLAFRPFAIGSGAISGSIRRSGLGTGPGLGRVDPLHHRLLPRLITPSSTISTAALSAAAAIRFAERVCVL